MHYLLLSARETYPSVTLRSVLDDVEWVSGAPLAATPPPLVFDVAGGEQFVWPDYIRPNSAIPLFSATMQSVLDLCGVANVIYYPATLVNLDTNETRVYLAANIIGIIPAMDLARSAFVPARSKSVMVRTIDRLALDPARCAAASLFRLAEYDSLIVVAPNIANALRQAALTGVRLLAPESWDGFID